MIDIIRVRLNQGYQAIRDVRKAKVHSRFRGFPILDQNYCTSCGACVELCPSSAITIDPLAIDLGACVFCGNCERVCAKKSVRFTNAHRLGTDTRERLIVRPGMCAEEFEKSAFGVRNEIRSLFGRSLKLRSVSAGGCNGCEMELNACTNVNFDMGRFGIDIVASPRHADGIVITGPVSENMAKALEDTYLSVPEPKIVIASGACAISGGIFAASPALNRSFFKKYKVDLFLPGCPVHPLTFVNGVLRLIRP